MRKLVAVCIIAALTLAVVAIAVVADDNGFSPEVQKLLRAQHKGHKGTISRAKLIKEMQPFKAERQKLLQAYKPPPPPPGGKNGGPPGGGPGDSFLDQLLDNLNDFIMGEVRKGLLGRVLKPIQQQPSTTPVTAFRAPFSEASATPDYMGSGEFEKLYQANAQTGYCVSSCSITQVYGNNSFWADFFMFLGGKYTMPSTGRVNVVAKFKNIHATGQTATDNWGDNDIYEDCCVFILEDSAGSEDHELMRLPPTTTGSGQTSATVNKPSVQINWNPTDTFQQGQVITVMAGFRSGNIASASGALSSGLSGTVDEIAVRMR